MSGYLDSAVLGVCITEPVLKQSAKGNAYLRILLAVGDGDGKQFCWVCAFGQDAERVASQLQKGGKLYAEGALSSEIYERDGRATVSLSIAARRVEALNLIGKNRPKKENADRSAGHDRRGDYDRAAGYRHPQHERPFDDYEAMR
jgi:single-stranded DNA-binding protein